MAPATPKIQLKVTGPDGVVRDVRLPQDNAIVGSGPSANIQLIDPKVSAVHFLLKTSKNGELTVLDLGSEAGTRLRGQLLKEPMVLTSGDLISVGGSTVRILIDIAEATEIVDARLSSYSAEPVNREVFDASDEAVPENPLDDLDAGSNRSPVGPNSATRVAIRSLKADLPPRDSTERSPPPKTRQDKPMSNLQTSVRGSAFALGPNGNKLLNEQFASDEQPTEASRTLEIALLWGDTIIDVRTYAPGATIKIGPTPQAQFRVYDEAIAEGFDLVANNAVKVPAGAKSAVYRDGRETAAGGEIPLGLGDRALVSLGTTHFIVRWIRPSAMAKTGFFDSADFYFTKVLSVAFIAHLVLLVGFWITPLNNDLLSEDLFKNPSALVKTIIKAPEKKKKFDLSGVKEGAKAKDKEGKMGKKEAKKPEAAPSKKGAPIVDAKKREEDRNKIMKSGLLAGLKGPEGASSNVFGPGGLGTGLNNALGGLQGGAGMGDAHGVGGLGSRGAGPGGGGTALGIGGLGTKGNGRGRGGYGNIDLGGRGKGETRIVPGKTIVQGSLSKDVIAAIIRKHQNEIKYCYEVELNKNPGLYGKVSVSFTIDGTGDVSEANVGETTMNNSNVENCMATKVRRWKFPEPKGGGQVFVTYPWVFKASGSDEE